MPLGLERLIEAMSDPNFFPHKPHNVIVIQTHISVVFIAGNLVYKVKKPLNFGFLDFTTFQKRRHYCEQEVLLNSRFSSGIYLGVVGIFDGFKGINLLGKGTLIDTAVLMRRIPAENILINRLSTQKIGMNLLDRIAKKIAQFHSQALNGPGIATYGSIETIRQNLIENFDQTKKFVGRTISERVYDGLKKKSFDYLSSHEALFQSRSANGHIRDCHGDLHLEHVVVNDDIMLIDCIEFNERFRYGDTAADLAFLLMDFDYRGFPAFGDRVSSTYAEISGDPDFEKCVRFYKSYRAFVRGKVTSFVIDEPEVEPQAQLESMSKASDYFGLSLCYLESEPPVALIITCGFTGSGKSWFARQFSSRYGAQLVQSDVVRKEQFGIDPGEHRLDKFGEGIYTSNATEKTYRSMFRNAQETLRSGRSVLLDASFSKKSWRDEAKRLAKHHSARFLIIHCVASEQTIMQRLSERRFKKHQPSDGRWEIYLGQLSAFEPLQVDELPYTAVRKSEEDSERFLRELIRSLLCDRAVNFEFTAGGPGQSG